MGMAASQVRLLQLTGRKNDIGRELQFLSLEKMSLTREMREVSRNYNEALSSKVLKWSNNSGVTYQDLSYSILMRPNAANNNSPVLLTDSSGKVVIDGKYKKYAEMLSPNGAAGGSWSGDTRTNILASLLGISEEDINNYTQLETTLDNDTTAMDKAKADYLNWLDSAPASAVCTAEDCMGYIGSISGMDSSSNYTLSSGSDIKKLTDAIKNNMSKYFTDSLGAKDKTAFTTACDDAANALAGTIDASGEKGDSERSTMGITGSTGNWTIPVSTVMQKIMSCYTVNGGTSSQNEAGERVYSLQDTESTEWNSWYTGLEAKQKVYEDALSTYNTNNDSRNQIFKSEQEKQIAFYDKIFTAISENGWIADDGVEDNDYLNQMLQNNQYYVVTMVENDCYDEEATCGCGSYRYDYEMDDASCYKNIFVVNDSGASYEAQAEYEYQKNLINEKETRVDTRMKNLETEQNSIIKMIESIEKVKDDNAENHMNVFT